jgi:hypothetical protein
MDLPLDCFAVIVEKLDSKDVASLLYVSKQVRQDTMAVLQPQQCLWAAGKILNKEYAEKALYAGARINKIDPATGKNVLKMIEGRSGGEELEHLEGWNTVNRRFEGSRVHGLAQTQEELNRHLVRCVKQVAGLEFYGDPNGASGYDGIHIEYTLDEFHPYDTDDYDVFYYDDDDAQIMGIREALLDGADPNVRTQCAYGPHEPDMDLEGGLLHILTVSVIEKRNVDITVRIINELKSFGIDMNQVDDNRSLPRSTAYSMPSLSTALHYACRVRLDGRLYGEDCEPNIRPKIVEALLNSGADPNKGNSDGDTPLHDLVYYDWAIGEADWVIDENHTLAKMLIDNGADARRCNNDRMNVLDLIFDFGDDAIDLTMAAICLCPTRLAYQVLYLTDVD